jgi:hypothetical protein
VQISNPAFVQTLGLQNGIFASVYSPPNLPFLRGLCQIRICTPKTIGWPSYLLVEDFQHMRVLDFYSVHHSDALNGFKLQLRHQN